MLYFYGEGDENDPLHEDEEPAKLVIEGIQPEYEIPMVQSVLMCACASFQYLCALLHSCLPIIRVCELGYGTPPAENEEIGDQEKARSMVMLIIILVLMLLSALICNAMSGCCLCLACLRVHLVGESKSSKVAGWTAVIVNAVVVCLAAVRWWCMGSQHEMPESCGIGRKESIGFMVVTLPSVFALGGLLVVEMLFGRYKYLNARGSGEESSPARARSRSRSPSGAAVARSTDRKTIPAVSQSSNGKKSSRYGGRSIILPGMETSGEQAVVAESRASGERAPSRVGSR
ncbi:unnamed protein product, partial [Amoebophrya sp. A25]|eukprot:GSA25T00005844001.1